VNYMPETAGYLALLSRRCRLFMQGNNVDIVGVTGSIPVTPTILFSCISSACGSLWGRFAYFPPGSLNPAPAYARNKSGLKGAGNTSRP